MDVLEKIIEANRARVIAAKEALPDARLREDAIEIRRSANRHALLGTLSKGERINIIAEFKRRSPSKGTIRRMLTPRRWRIVMSLRALPPFLC